MTTALIVESYVWAVTAGVSLVAFIVLGSYFMVKTKGTDHE